MRAEAPIRCSEWARRHFKLSPESSAVEGDFDPWPFQVAILDCMGNDEIRSISWRKPSRIGYTKCLSAATGYFHHHKRRNVLIYQPTDLAAKGFCKDTIDPMIRDVGCLQALLAASSKNNKENTLQTKYFLGSSLHIMGGTSAGNYRRLTKDVLIIDELDGFPSDVEGEGDPVSLGLQRIKDSSFPKAITGTTPTIDGRSLIQKREEEADLVFRFKVACIHCEERQHFEWGGPKAVHGFKWNDRDASTTHYVCRHCGGVWLYADAWDLQEGGRWETEAGHWIDPESRLRSPDDQLLAWPRSIAFVTWAALSLMFPWPEMVYEFLDAMNDVEKLKTFTNTTLAEYWKEEVVAVDPDPLYQRREPYEQAPEGVRFITIGADLQMDRLEYEVVGWGTQEESWSLAYRVIRGEPTKAELWAEFLRDIKRSFTTADGRELKARLVGLDCGYLPEEVYAFSRKAGIRFVVPMRGLSVMGRPIATMPRRPSREKKVYICQVGTDNAKETVYRRLLLNQHGPGYCHFPENEAYDEEHFAQLTGEEKRPVKRQGRTVLAFQQAYSNVEVLDCRVYALAAAKVAQDLFRGLDLKEAPRPAPVDPGTRRPEPPRENQRHEREGWVNRRRRGNWMKR